MESYPKEKLNNSPEEKLSEEEERMAEYLAELFIKQVQFEKRSQSVKKIKRGK